MQVVSLPFLHNTTQQHFFTENRKKAEKKPSTRLKVWLIKLHF